MFTKKDVLHIVAKLASPGGSLPVESKGTIKSLAELGPATAAVKTNCSSSALLPGSACCLLLNSVTKRTKF